MYVLPATVGNSDDDDDCSSLGMHTGKEEPEEPFAAGGKRLARWMSDTELAAVGVTTGMKKIFEKSRQLPRKQERSGTLILKDRKRAR